MPAAPNSHSSYRSSWTRGPDSREGGQTCFASTSLAKSICATSPKSLRNSGPQVRSSKCASPSSARPDLHDQRDLLLGYFYRDGRQLAWTATCLLLCSKGRTVRPVPCDSLSSWIAGQAANVES